MKERLYRILNIKFSESSQVIDLLTVQFFLGLANAFLNIVAFALFVYNFSVETLPVVYLSAAILLFVSNMAYEQIEKRFSPPQLLKFIIGISALLLIVLWFGLSFGNKQNFIFILLLSNTLVYMIISFAFWGLVSLLFNVRESRRVFSVVGAGDIPAKLIGYLVVPLLIPVLGLNNLIWIAILFLLIGLALFNKVIKKKSWDHIRNKVHAGDHHEVLNVKKKDLLNFFFKDQLIFTISLLSILSYNVFILIDYTFIAQVKIKFENISDLAVYIATFFALGRIVALVFKLIFTSRVIERLGIIYCLFITPFALLIFCIMFLWYGNNAEYNVFVFGAMALLTEVLRSTMQEPVFFILFQPLKEQLRLKGHIISKGYMLPPSLIIVGLSLLFLYKTHSPITILFTIKIILANLFVWAIIIFFIQKAYLKTLHSSIKKGIIDSEDFYINDQTGINLLIQKVRGGKNIEVIYALNLLDKANYVKLDELLLEQLTESSDLEIKKYALDQLDKKGKINSPILKKILAVEPDEMLQQKLTGVLCKHDPAFLKNLSDSFADQRSEIKKIIIINLLNQQEFTYLFKAGNEINNLITSPDFKDRELAVSIISKVKHIQFAGVIEKLINDDEISVRRLAITAACKLNIKSLLPLILERSDELSNKYLVLKALLTYGDSLFEDIHILNEKLLLKHTNDLIKISGKIKGPHSTGFLLSVIDRATGKTNIIVNALWNKEYEPETAMEINHLKSLLNNTLKIGSSKIKDYNEVPDLKEKNILKESIYNEVKGDLMVALKICVMLFRKKEINRILELIEMEGNVKVFNAMEMLELMLPQRISKELNNLFDFVLDPSHQKQNFIKDPLNSFFQKVFNSKADTFNSWTKAVCIYSSWKNKDTGWITKNVHLNGTAEDFIITETREFVLKSIK
jgi:ATP:ADP antiporter, AAA family